MKMKREVEVVICEVCGEKADGTYSETVYVNGDVSAEMYCPLDLCKEHISLWARLMPHTSRERYDAKIDHDRKDIMIRELKLGAKWRSDK